MQHPYIEDTYPTRIEGGHGVFTTIQLFQFWAKKIGTPKMC